MTRTAIKSQTSSRVRTTLDKSMLRTWIIEEYRLRKEVARQEELRRNNPDVWRWQEDIRIAGNRADAALNRELREAGCQPVAPSPSLNQKVKKLQQLEARNRAAIATLGKPNPGFRNKSRRHAARTP